MKQISNLQKVILQELKKQSFKKEFWQNIAKFFIFLLLGFSLAYLFFPVFHGIDRLRFVLMNVFGVNIVSFRSTMRLAGSVLAVLFFILALKAFPFKGKTKISKETLYLIFLASISLAVAVEQPVRYDYK